MTCYVHQDKEAVGTCVNCGKFICAECATEIQGKYHCKACVNEVFNRKEHEIEKTASQPQQPMVFMNAGGGASSSSSSSSSASGGRGYGRMPPYPRNSIGVHILLLFLTAGIGNVIYYLYIRGQQNSWNAAYRN